MRGALLLCAVLVTSGSAWSHGLRTAYLQLDELEPGQASLQVSLSVPAPGVRVAVEGCQLEARSSDATGLRQLFELACPGRLAGRRISVAGLGPIVADAVIDASLAGGKASHLVTTDAPGWQLPLGASGFAIAEQYVRLGVRHILSGPDHLLFLLLLVLVLRRPRSVLLAETAFTLSHSLSFTANALGWVQVSAPVAEACIALSLLLLAVDVGRPGLPPSALRGAAAALGFGLVHGLGFAAGLRDVGLPDHAVGMALVAFGGGVELGQIAFLALALVTVGLLQRLQRWPEVLRASMYVAGSVSAYWLFDRLWSCFFV